MEEIAFWALVLRIDERWNWCEEPLLKVALVLAKENDASDKFRAIALVT